MDEPSTIKHALSVIKLHSYTLPDFVEQKGKDWILYGADNTYPNYLINLYQRSSQHNAIITNKVDYIAGNGWKGTGNEAKKFILKPNPDENLAELSSKVALDIEIFGGAYLNIRRDKGGAITAVDHLPFARVRTNEDMSVFYYTKNWGKRYARPNLEKDWKVFPAYNPEDEQPSSILYFQNYTPKNTEYDIYPIPEYIACIPYIEISYEIANFHLNNIKNSFWGSFFINFYSGIPTAEEQKTLEVQMAKKFTGTSNAGKFVMNFANSKETAAELTPITPNEMDKLFEQLNKTVRDEIFIGHKMPKILLGVMTEGQLGGRTEILEQDEIFKNKYVLNRQKTLEDIFNYLLTGDRAARVVTLTPKSPLLPELSVSELNTITVSGIITAEETRDILNKKYNLQLQAQPLPAPTPPVVEPKQFSADDEKRIIALFAAAGQPAENFEVLKVRRGWFGAEAENKLYRQCFATPLTGTVNDRALGILRILDKNPDATPIHIARELKITIAVAKQTIADMVKAGLLEGSEKNLTITPAGEEAVPPPKGDITDISIKYRYALNPAYPGPVLIPTSREFCRELIGMAKVFDRREIEQIANVEDYNVFLYKGGWYHTPTGENSPSCRHVWESLVVKVKR